MNLVQINEHLKDTSIQKLLDYQNGMNPEVPAYMATGELKRREIMDQREKASQQAAQGKQPTVKEQVEQKAGLMALQAKQQEMAQQQQAQQPQQQPMPVPPGIPQPPMQEEEQPEFAAASGGIARLPVRDDMFKFGSGGIIAFAAGEQVPVVQETEEEKRRKAQFDDSYEHRYELPASKPAPAEKPLSLQEILSDPAARKAAMSVLTPQQLSQINTDRLQAREMAGVKGEYGEEQRRRLAQEEEQYKGMLKDRSLNRALAVLSGMGQGGLGGAAPAYLQSQAAEQSADIAQKRRLNELYGNLDKAQREEAMAAATGMTTEQARQKNLAGTTGGAMFSAQTQGLAALEAEDRRTKSESERQGLLLASNQKIAQMNKDTQLEIAKLDRNLRSTLHSTPSATIDTTAVANYVAAGMSPTEAYERVRALTSSFRGEMTRDQAEDNVRRDISDGLYMKEISEAQKKAKESGVPFDMETWKRKKVESQMATSGRTTMGRPTGTVDTSNPLLK